MHAIHHAYYFQKGEMVDTGVYWEAAKKFAEEHGADMEDNNSGLDRIILLKMSIQNEEVWIYFHRTLKGGELIFLLKEKKK